MAALIPIPPRRGALLPLLFLLLGAAGAGEWRLTPARWLMEPAELRDWRDLDTTDQAAEFLEEFWRRRDPDPRREGNPRRETFESRSEEANALFAGEGGPGVLTSRGRAYLLVGPPSALRQLYRRAPALGAMEARGRRRPLATRPLLVEKWSWRPEDISPALRRELEKRNWKLALEVEFEVGEGEYTLLQGEELLRLAARSWLGEEGRR